MRQRRWPWLLVALLALGLGAALWRPDSVARRLGFGAAVYERHHAEWRAELRAHHRRLDATTPADAVVFVGDSYVQGLNAARVRACTAAFGIGGETVSELADRLPDLRSTERASAVVVMAGLNDVLQQRDATLGADYRRLLAALPADKPVLLSSLPRLATHATELRRANKLARSACAAHANCRFVDLAAAMPDPARLLEADGRHLNPAGYAVWTGLLRAALDASRVVDRRCDL